MCIIFFYKLIFECINSYELPHMLLNYEKEILEETKNTSFILIGSYGLHLNLVMNINIMLYLNKYSLVFLINYDESNLNMQHEYLRNTKNLDKTARNKLYLKGGVFICSSRILLTDFLENNIPMDKISTMIIRDADRIKENSLEAFILYVYRKNNQNGLIKAFSTNCIPFAYGLGSLERICNTLRTNNLILYPRFHQQVVESFEKDIVYTEHKLKLTDQMLEIQMIMIEIIKELLRNNKIDVDYELILISNAYMTNQVNDIRDIKFLIELLVSCNTLKFYMECMRLINKQIELGKDSTWLNSKYTLILIDKIDLFFLENQQMLRDEQKEAITSLKCFFKNKKYKKTETAVKNDEYTDTQIYETNLDSFLKDINTDKYNLKFKRLVELLMNKDEEICFLLFSSPTVKFDIESNLESLGRKLINNVKFYTRKEFNDADILTDDGKLEKKFIEMNNCLNESRSIDEFYIFHVGQDSAENKEKILYQNPYNVIRLRKNKNYKFILYDLEISSIRKCEYIGNKVNIKVDSFMYKDSLEEQKYLNSLRKEKLYFEQLIEKRSKLPVLLDNDKNILEELSSEENENIYKIVVDSRELRSELPFFLYKAGNLITVSTLQIGDYLLNEKICVERKNISDLISSIKSGRLYNQARMLTFHYHRSILLIEFNCRPCLSDFYNHDTDTFRNSLVSKFCLFIITFPTVRVIWSESSLFSTKIFRQIQNKEADEPDITKLDIDPILQEVLLSIPGINQFNLRKVIKSFHNIKNIVNSRRGELIRKMGKETGIKIFNFFNEGYEN
jgi:DNA excision repair protein ERCC-4